MPSISPTYCVRFSPFSSDAAWMALRSAAGASLARAFVTAAAVPSPELLPHADRSNPLSMNATVNERNTLVLALGAGG